MSQSDVDGSVDSGRIEVVMSQVLTTRERNPEMIKITTDGYSALIEGVQYAEAFGKADGNYNLTLSNFTNEAGFQRISVTLDSSQLRKLQTSIGEALKPQKKTPHNEFCTLPE
jgi:hypothetical protein